MKIRLLVLALLFSASVFAQKVSVQVSGNPNPFPFQNPDLGIDQRVADLVSRLTLEEKAGLLLSDAPGIPRLGIQSYNWWNECLHGVARNGQATVFPQAIGMAAAFDTDMMFRIGEAISDEARAKYNMAMKQQGFPGKYQGLTFWTPNINIFRDPRWGRGQETYGEDPYLTSRIGVAFVKGLQGDDPRYVKAAALAKHYAVHSGPEASRHEFNAEVSMKDLWETYLPAFEALVKEAKVEGVMGAYNRMNGDLCCAHPYLMQEVLRKQWGFKGYYVSDCGAIDDFYNGHNTVKTAPEAAALALSFGCNINCGNTYKEILTAIQQGIATEKEVDDNLREQLPTLFRLGIFDPRGSVPFDNIGPGVVGSPEHIALAKEAATKSIVLLKNKDQVLPMSKDIGSIFMCGPTATDVEVLLGNYYPIHSNLVTILEGIAGKVSPATSFNYRQGILLDEPNRNPIDWVTGNAATADVTIVCMGISPLMEGEEGAAIASPVKGDRVDIALPQNQVDFLKKVRANAKKLVVIMTGGSAIACPEVLEMADALLWVWYPGEQGGVAVGDLLFGDAVPSGRLPVTFPMSLNDLPPYEDYAMKGRTYRYMEKTPLFPFGFGLSYTNFQYSNVKLSKTTISKGASLEAEVTLANTGKYAAEEVVQLYISDLEASTVVPQYALKSFKRVALQPGASQKVTFAITPDMLEMVNEKGTRLLESGTFKVWVGGSVPSQRSLDLGAPAYVQTIFKVN